ncbi:hypothetical protein OG599_20780 [Streptomyces sp. NBC_01335]|uniref:hypothetical protein n=1 Tax=Streptomyces sp. NBC_01335 TaxID=2903828 RepID=UPI002E11F6CE|nr:hypothetical protein OG599_20780 [Streptomyces sp. NBC_01335]
MTTNRVSVLISILGVPVSVMLLYVSVQDYRAGASSFWIWSSAVVLLGALYALVKDVRQLRTGPTA